jgi:hypothetical protein
VPLYGMRCIAGVAHCRLTAIVSQKHSSRDELASVRLGHAQPPGSQPPNEKELKGVARLVNPRDDDADLGAGDDDPGERDYLGRLLHVADEALDRVKNRWNQRKRRRVH